MKPGTALDYLRPTVPKTQALGPAMAALTSRQRHFVTILWERAPISATQAYIEAGYTCNRVSAQSSSSALLQDPKINAAIVEFGRSYSAAFAPELHRMLINMAMNPQVGPSTQAKVGLAMLQHAGFVEEQNQNINVNINITRQEKIEAIRADLIADGATPEQIARELGSFAEYEVIEGEFTEVEEDPFRNETY